MIRLSNIKKVFRTDEIDTWALREVNLEVKEGEFVAIMGPSGSGKSTCMNMIGCLDRPTSGIVKINGKETAKMSEKELSVLRNQTIGFVFQQYHLISSMNVIENVMLPLKYQKLDRSLRHEKALAALESVGLEERIHHKPHELSGGMLQRVCIVMALLSKPRLIIADEPTTALDVTVQAQVLAVLKDMANRTGTAVLLITHNMGIVSQYADRVAVMYAGRIVETGPVRDVIDNPMHPYTQGLLAAIPENHSDMRTMKSIPGSVPHPKDFVQGCRFADRCEKCANASAEMRAKCLSKEMPPRVAAGDSEKHEADCFGL